MKKIFSLTLALALAACAPKHDDQSPVDNPSPVKTETPDESVVRGSATVTVTSNDISAMANGSATVTYANAPSVNFKIDASALVAGAMTGNTLSLGKVAVSDLSDNALNICGTNGKTKCTKAIIRLYTTGTIAGFVNTSDSTSYGVPVFASGLNPTTALTLGSPGVTTQQVTIANNTHVLKLADFTSPSYDITSDFSNAGAGQYSMTLVVEYALSQ